MNFWQKCLVFALGVVVIISGVFCGISWWLRAHRKSYIVGSIDLSNQFHQQNFYQVFDRVVFYPVAGETDLYEYREENLAAVDNFNGAEKEYQLKINDYVIYDAQWWAGAVQCDVHIDFYETDGTLKAQGGYHLSIRFLANRTELVISCVGQENQIRIEQYFYDYNCRIKITEIKGDLL